MQQYTRIIPLTHRCSTKGCKNKIKVTSTRCKSCVNREWRKRNPVLYAYLTLKQNAKRRKIEFSLTFEEFAEFCVEYDYISKKGRSATSLTIDRDKNEFGYHIWNIKPMQKSLNCSKGTKILNYDWRNGIARVYTLRADDRTGTDDLPF